MIEIKLIKPTLEYANDIMSFRQEMGYSVRPSERRKGYAKEMLRQNLQNCKNRGLNKVLITCDYDNVASEKTIIANGGLFEKEICVDDNRINRYWIVI